MKKSLFTLLALGLFAANAFGQAYMSERLLDEISKAEAKGTPVKALVVLKDQADIRKLDQDLYAMKAGTEYRAYTVITTLQRKADATQGSLIQLLASKRTTEVLNYQSFWIVNMIAVEAVPSALWELSRHADVGSMDIDAVLKYDEPVKRSPAKAFSPGGAEPGLKAINAHLMWAAGFTGAGYIVMNDDTGVQYNHPAFAARWRGNFVSRTQAWFDSGSPSAANPSDCDGHGTHTMGTMCGMDPATNDTVGVAFGAQWIASKGICSSPHASNSIAAWQWAMNPDSNAGTVDDMPVAIGNSWYDPDIGSDCSTDPAQNPYYNAIISVEASGIAIVFSAGNSGPGASTLTMPKNMMVDLTTPFTTAAVNANTSWPYAIASFSSRGPSTCTPPSGPDSLRLKLKPEISAPGVSVRSSYPTSSYSSLDGTSMACPHVVGALTLLKQAHPGMTGKQLKMALYETARDLGDPGEDNTYGMGMIDVWAAHLSLADPTDPKPVTNAALYSDYSTPTSMMITWTDPTEFENGTLLDTFVIDVYRNSALVGTAPKGAEHYVESGLSNHQLVQYDLYVRHIGTDSLSSKVTTGAWHVGGHPTPKAPTDLDVTSDVSSAYLSWTNPTENLDGTPINDLAYIRIYRDGVQIDSVAAPGTNYTDVIYTLDGAFYTYKVQAIDNEAPVNVSGFSNEDEVYVGPVPGIMVYPDPVVTDVLTTGMLDTTYFYIVNTGLDTLKISNIEAEEISTEVFVPKWTQEQKYTPEYPKGAKEPTFGRVTEGSGGPDPFGYKWKDSDAPGGPVFNWYDISGIGTALTFSSADDGYADVTIPFGFNYYGTAYTQARVRTNGWIGFDMSSTLTSYSNAAIPATATPNLAVYPFWDDMDLDDGGTVYYYYDSGNNRFIIQYHAVAHYGGGGTYTYQILLYPSGKVVFQYLTMTGTLNSATIGIENSAGTMGLQCVYNASYVHDNMAIVFQKSVEWLSLSPATGNVAPGDSMKVDVMVNSAGMIGGLYKAKALIEHNIPLVATYEHPEIQMPVVGVPDIAVSPAALDYGIQYVTFPDTMTFNVQSTGTDTLEVTAFTTTLSEYSVVTPVPFKVAVGASYPVKVAFFTSVVGIYTDSVVVTSNGGTATVQLTAEAINNPVMAIAPDTMFFELLTNELDTSTFSISNVGTGVLNITGIETEEISTESFIPKWTQEQKFTPDYPKGSDEPAFGTQTEGAGGPDPYGYRWKDSDEPGGPAANFIDISTTGTQITFSSNDDAYVTIPLPFPVKYYGQSYSGNLTVSTNGWVGFDTYTSNYLSNAAIPATALPNNIVALLWDDLNGNNGGSKVVYSTVGNKFIVQYVNWNRYSQTGGDLNFEVIFTQNSDKVELQYGTMNFGTGTNATSHTIGIENAGGTMGLQCVYNAAYVHNNMAVVFQRGIPWLTYGPKTDTLGTSETMDVEVIANATGMLGGTYFGKFMVESNDPAHQPVWEKPIVKLRVIGVPDIGVSPGLLDFGTNFINYPDTLEFTVTNTGTDLLTVSGLSLTQGLPEYAIVTAVPFDVAIGEDYPVKVAFDAATIGTFTDTVRVVSNGNSGDKIVALTGTAIELPVIDLSSTDIINSVAMGDTDHTELVIRNLGSTDLTFSIAESQDVFTYLAKPVKTTAPRADDINYGGPHYFRKAPAASGSSNTEGTMGAGDINGFGILLGTGLVKFDLTAPTSLISMAANTQSLFAADFSTDNSVYWAVDDDVKQFGTIDTATGAFTAIGPLTGVTTYTTGLAVDPETEIIYLSATDGTTSTLYTVNPATGTPTLVGTITGVAGAIDIGISPDDGQMYTYCVVSDHFYSVNKATGAATDIGALGYNANYAQGMDFDPNDGTCYLAAYNGATSQGELRTVDLSTGATTLVGLLGAGTSVEVDGFAIHSLGLNWIDEMPLSGTVSAGDSAVIALSWYGLEVGSHEGYLGVSSNDPATPMTNVHLQLTTLVGIEDQTKRPATYALHQNYPNPFNPTTTIKYDLKDAGKVTLKVYNILGQEVRTLVNKNETAGFKSVVWDGKDNSGRMVSSGLYIYRIEAGRFVKSHKMMFLK